MHGDGPLAKRQAGAGHDCAGPDGEVPAAGPAPVGRGLAFAIAGDPAGAAAQRAGLWHPIPAPAVDLEPLDGCLLIGKHLHDLHQGEALAEGLAGGCLYHIKSLSTYDPQYRHRYCRL